MADVAAHLVAAGSPGNQLAELAGLCGPVAGWEIDQLLPAVLAELRLPEMDVDEAGLVSARLLAQRYAADSGHHMIRALAIISPGLDYPGGVIGRAWHLSEWPDCDCHAGSPERVEAAAWEQELKTMQRLHIADGLVDALTD